MGKAAGIILAIAAIAIAGPLAGFLGFGSSGLGFLIARTVIAMGIQSLGGSLLGLNSSKGGDAVKASAILANEASSIAAIPIVYGRRLVGTKRIYLNVNDNNQYMHLVMAVSEGEIGRIRKVYFNDELAVDFTDPAATETGSVPNGESIDPGSLTIASKYRNDLRMRYRLGSETQTAIAYVTSKFAEWTTAAQCKGVALVYFELKFNRDVYSQVPTITVEIDGIEIENLASLGTFYSVYTNPTVPDSFGANPADVLYDYLTNDLYGKGIATSAIDLPSFLEVRSYCLQTQTAVFGITSYSFSRYLLNGHLTPQETIYNNIKRILASFNGYLIYSNGLYVLKINAPRTGVQATDSNLFLFDESNMVGAYDLQLGNKQSRFNQVKLNYFDQDQRYSPNIVYYADATYLARDNNQVLEREMDLPMVTDTRQANFIAAIVLNQSRYTSAISFTSAYTALQVEVGDVVRISISNLGFVEKQFRVMSMGLNVDGTIQLTAIEYSDTMYTVGTLPEIPLPGTAPAVTVPAGSSLQTTAPAAPTSLSASTIVTTQGDGSKIVSITASWTGSTTVEVNQYQVRVANGGTRYYLTTGTSIIIGPLPNGTYTVGVTAITAAGGRSTELL